MKPFKSLSIPEQNAEVARIVAQCDTDTTLIESAVKRVGDVLEADELLIAMIAGTLERALLAKGPVNLGLGNPLPKLIALTDRRIVAVQKRTFGGVDATSLPLDQIDDVAGKTGILAGAVHIQMQGETRMIGSVRKSSVEPFVELVMATIDAVGATTRDEMGAPAVAQAPSEPNQAEASPPAAAGYAAPALVPADTSEGAAGGQIADELEKLASLMERGILTPEEFAQQKAKLLQG